MSGMLRGVVVGHGELAQGLVSAARRITGVEQEALTALTNEGTGPDELKNAILERVGEGPAVVFTDLGAGSCSLAARISCRERATVAVITGVNLPMLLEFIFHRDLELGELLPRLEAKAREGVKVLSSP